MTCNVLSGPTFAERTGVLYPQWTGDRAEPAGSVAISDKESARYLIRPSRPRSVEASTGGVLRPPGSRATSSLYACRAPAPGRDRADQHRHRAYDRQAVLH